ncbi:OLC1v1013327C1 [Oldenlandia corymbosa var. corymbosa]|uniref:OLC1v1013327C1 n=1 Tax=Oldenlandia corymbosa var. corymbosa TaxID=529605 RepID=A0AAV1E1L5_OLDCO|nr:OLC1v1013327C1 [Oldenlandia corymbosa var. corymbosa]
MFRQLPQLRILSLEVGKISYAPVVAKEGKAAPSVGHKIIRVAPSTNQQPKTLVPSSNNQQPTSNIANGAKERTSKTNIAKGAKERTSKTNAASIGMNKMATEDSRATLIYIENRPTDIAKDELAQAVKVFGVARPSGIQIRTYRVDGFCYGFVEFESEASAKSAVEARKLSIRGFDARISLKKYGTIGGTGGEFRSRNFKGQEKGEIPSNRSSRDDNGGRGYDGQNQEFSERNSGSRDGSAYGGEGHPKNSGRNGGQRKNGQVAAKA